MKRVLHLVPLILILPFISFSQAPLQWAKTFGGSGTDIGESIKQTADSGFIIAGFSNSIDQQVTGNHGGYDIWVVKTDKNGTIQWQKSYGGTANDEINSIQITPDGGYIIGGWSQSNDGEVTGNHGGADYWILKISGTGTLQWQKSYGGSANDYLTDIQLTSDRGYIASGITLSNNGDVTGNHGGATYGDEWIIKIDSIGTIQWQKALGGSADDYASKIQPTTDSGYIVSGFSNSNNGDVSGNHGGFDYWIVKLAHTGIIQWQQSFGGSGDDLGQGIKQTSDGGYIVNGFANSPNNGNVTGNHGANDFWVVKITSTGSIQWEKSLGGSQNDQGGPVQITADGGYVVSGHSQSNDGNVTGHHAGTGLNWDYWIAKLNASGTLQWEKSLGGTGDDINYDMLPTKDLGYILEGHSTSTNGDVTGNHGGDDYWVVKLSADSLLNLPPQVSIAAKPGTTICAKTKVTFTATASNTDAAVVFQWEKDNITVGTNSATYTDSLLNNNDSVICVITDAGKTATSNKLKFIVNPLLTPSVSIIATPGIEVCTGVKVVLAATAVNGGTGAKYQWKKNGLNVGGDSTTYTDSIPQNGDSISVTLTSTAACLTAASITSNVVKIKVDAPVPVISITANKKDTICSNTTVTFTAMVNPVFEWKKDGNIVGNSTNTYKDSLLKNGDYVQCFIVSGISACNGSSSNVINSNQIKFDVNSAPAEPSAISGPVTVPLKDKNIYFSVTAIAGVTYAWTLPKGAVIDSGQGGNKIKVNWDSTGGNVSVIAINSCGSSPARLLTVGVTGGIVVNPASVNKIAVTDNGLKLYPNPAGASATLQFTSKTPGKYSITVLDGSSNVVDIKSGTSISGANTVKINTANYASGVYFITITDKEHGQRSIEFMKGAQ